MIVKREATFAAYMVVRRQSSGTEGPLSQDTNSLWRKGRPSRAPPIITSRRRELRARSHNSWMSAPSALLTDSPLFGRK